MELGKLVVTRLKRKSNSVDGVAWSEQISGQFSQVRPYQKAISSAWECLVDAHSTILDPIGEKIAVHSRCHCIHFACDPMHAFRMLLPLFMLFISLEKYHNTHYYRCIRRCVVANVEIPSNPARLDHYHVLTSYLACRDCNSIQRIRCSNRKQICIGNLQNPLNRSGTHKGRFHSWSHHTLADSVLLRVASGWFKSRRCPLWGTWFSSRAMTWWSDQNIQPNLQELLPVYRTLARLTQGRTMRSHSTTDSWNVHLCENRKI